jgi:hypothetical protein
MQEVILLGIGEIMNPAGHALPQVDQYVNP